MHKFYSNTLGGDVMIEAAELNIAPDDNQLMVSIGIGTHSESRPFIAMDVDQLQKLNQCIDSIVRMYTGS